MRDKYRPHHILEVVLLFIALAGFSASNSKANENSKYLDAVREFADNVLKYGRDTYGPKHTPLFVDGLNIHTHEPVKWIAPNGDRWILSNLASQQNLFRTLDGLTKITGDPKYRQAAVEAIEYAFDNLQTPNGLLCWGGHIAYDVGADRPCGGDAHELKGFYPYYRLMWEVDPQATKRFIEAFWSAHILDWSNLEMNRHGSISESLEMPWKHEYEGGSVFEYTSDGYSSISTGSDLVYAAAWLTKLSGDEEPLVWGKRLVRRYVKTRHPKTGISYWCYTKSKDAVRESYDDIMRKLVLGTTDFPISEFPWYTDTNPIVRECCRGYVMSTPGISIHWALFIWQNQFLLGEILGEEGDEFKQWALEELTAFGKASYRKRDNVYVPILTDGTNLEGYVVKEDGPLGPKGVTLEPLPAGPSDFWTYALGFRVTGDDYMWKMAHNISKGNEFGDIGATPKYRPQLKIGTDCSNPYALPAFLELHRGTGKDRFLGMAKRIGDNILDSRFHKGFFVASNKHIYTKFDAIDSLVLLHLHSELVGGSAPIPEVWSSKPFFETYYRKKDTTIDNQIFYTLTESAEPPMSLQEAAAVGDLGLVRTLIANGTDVNGREDSFFKTALHRAAMSGHRDIVEFLLSRGADVDARDSYISAPLHYAARRGHKDVAELLISKGADVNATNAAGDTPLHSAVRTGHKDIVELLITKGADVNAKNNNGQTPLDIAVTNNRKDIIELLIAKGADTSIHVAASIGDLDKVKSFIGEGTDVNAKDQDGSTPLAMAVSGGHIDVVKFLIDKGADVNLGDESNWTPLYSAVIGGHKDVAELLLAKGAGVNAKDKWGYTPLYYAIWRQDKDTVKLLVDKGADVNVLPKDDGTPLEYAVWNEDVEMAKLSVARGAKFDLKDNDGWTAFRYAASQGNRELVELFVAKGADVSTFHLAACMGDLARVKRFEEQGTNVDTKGRTWLDVSTLGSPNWSDRGSRVPYLQGCRCKHQRQIWEYTIAQCSLGRPPGSRRVTYRQRRKC